MIVFAIDPGPEQSAYLKWDGSLIRYKGIAPNEALLRDLHLISADVLVIEQIKSYGMPVSDSVFDTVYWTGRFAQVWQPKTADCALIPRLTVKMHICHDSRAKDSNIRQALISRFGPPGTKKNPGLTYGLKADMWAAFALAVYYYDTHAK